MTVAPSSPAPSQPRFLLEARVYRMLIQIRVKQGVLVGRPIIEEKRHLARKEGPLNSEAPLPPQSLLRTTSGGR